MEKRYNDIIELIELQEFLSVIERDDKGNAIKVSYAYEKSPDRTRLAKNEIDFEEIYKRELARYNITIKNNNTSIEEFKEIINEMIANYKKTHSYKLQSHKKRDIDLLNIAYSFIRFLDSKVIHNTEPTKSKKDESFLWFKVGLLFATGEINEYLTENKKALKISAKDTAIALGNISFEKFILANINNYKDANNQNKNIFANRKKMLKIIDYCTKKKLNIEQDFIDRIPSE